MGVSDWADHQAKKQERKRPKDSLEQDIWREKKRDRLSDTGLQRLSGKRRKK